MKMGIPIHRTVDSDNEVFDKDDTSIESLLNQGQKPPAGRHCYVMSSIEQGH